MSVARVKAGEEVRERVISGTLYFFYNKAIFFKKFLQAEIGKDDIVCPAAFQSFFIMGREGIADVIFLADVLGKSLPT